MAISKRLTGLREIAVTNATFMRASKKSRWTHGDTMHTLETWQRTLDKDLEEVYAVMLNAEMRKQLKDLTVVLDDGTVGVIAGFQVKLNNKEESK